MSSFRRIFRLFYDKLILKLGLNFKAFILNSKKSKKNHVINSLNISLYKIGMWALIVLMMTLFISTRVFNQPIGFFIERSANYLSYSSENKQYRFLGKFLLNYFPIDDWNIASSQSVASLKSRKDWHGQGASIEIKYTQQQFQEKTPLAPVFGRYQPYLDHIKQVFTTAELLLAIKSAQAGDTIQLMPGVYIINHNVSVVQKGHSNAPITVRSSQLGLVKIKFNALEGFHVYAPYWVFENLEIHGLCSDHNECEHAFHVVGNAHSLVLRNNKIVDFNAALKVNGLWVKGKIVYPDYGLVEKNSFYNTGIRQTNNPVTLLNIDNVSHWVVRSNYIADFSKGLSDHISYGTFMKGNGHNGLYENNLIICEHLLQADRGRRVGLSFGGGGTNKKFCRENNCDREHTNGIIRNNIILNCSHDVGIYLNKSKHTKIYNNLIFNSLGIDIQFENSNAVIINNIISGRIRAKDNGAYTEKNNYIDADCIAPDRQFSDCSFIDWYQDIINANTRLNQQGLEKISGNALKADISKDFCSNPPNSKIIDIGPIQYSNKLNCSADYINVKLPGKH